MNNNYYNDQEIRKHKFIIAVSFYILFIITVLFSPVYFYKSFDHKFNNHNDEINACIFAKIGDENFCKNVFK